MDEYEKRKQAISRYEAGEKVTSIVGSLGKSRRWFYNWLERWKSCKGQGDWFADRSRAPKTKPTKVGASLEQQVIAVRGQLERSPSPMSCATKGSTRRRFGPLTGLSPAMG